MEVLGHIPDISSRNEARVGVKVGSNVLIQQFVSKAPPIPQEHAFVVLPECIADGRGSNRAAGNVNRRNNCTRSVSGRNHAAKPRSPILAKPKAGIKAAHSVEVAVILAVDKNGANTALSANIVTNAAHCEISTRSAQQGMVGNDEARRAIVGDEETEIPRSLLPGKPRTKTRLDNAAGKNKLLRFIYAQISIAGKNRAFEVETQRLL